MARKPPSTLEPSPNLSIGQIRRCIERLNRCIGELEAFDTSKIQKRFTEPSVLALQISIEEALVNAFGQDTAAHKRYEGATRLDRGPIVMRAASPFGRGHPLDNAAQDASDARRYSAEGKQRSLVLLAQAVRALEDQLADKEATSDVETPSLAAVTSIDHPSKVFIVHGHDQAALQGLARFLEKIGLETIILSEQPNRGRSIVEKFEDYAMEVGFAVILLTPDDLGASVTEPEQQGRARQNVIFELGYFAGKLGRGKVCLLRKGEVEIPSDLYGVVYTPMDAAEGWKIALVKELKAARLEFDANKAWA